MCICMSGYYAVDGRCINCVDVCRQCDMDGIET